MPAAAFRDRPFQAFLSHAHADNAVVDRLHAWLTTTAGLPIWYDATHLSASARIASDLGSAMAQSRGALIVISKAALESGWVEDEWNQASVERNRKENRGRFRIIPVRIEPCEVPSFLEPTKWVDLVGRVDDLAAYAEILHGFYAGDVDIEAVRPVDIYVSRTWREGREQPLADQVCALLSKQGLRLIGDSPEWPTFQGDRVRSIMRSCTGQVSIIPNRQRTREDDKLKHFIGEARTAEDLKLPRLLIAEQGTDLPATLAKRAVFVPAGGFGGGAPLEAQVAEAVQELAERCRNRPRLQHIFLAVDLAEGRRNQIVRQLVQHVTSMPTVIGEQLRGDGIQRTIVEQLRNAVLVIADITGDNLNICIEAGIARGAGVECYLLTAGQRRQPPFMLRDIEPRFYQSDVELVGLIHNLVRPYRRKVLNFESAT